MTPGPYSDDFQQPTTSSVLKREVPWQTYLTARLISDRDLQLIRGYDKKDPEMKREALKQVCRRCSLWQVNLGLARAIQVGSSLIPYLSNTTVISVLCTLGNQQLRSTFSI